eukprot:TRINITY_DN15528_c0_g1_i1.p1 TRINITY_DN15528_c0_g1~~TRINITY_DN15528_c0_g1_i1.p1  ORF type:complete len:186 (+),score=26.51 TRINITY_DN15528_c0_g1_i1:18-575(+)
MGSCCSSSGSSGGGSSSGSGSSNCMQFLFLRRITSRIPFLPYATYSIVQTQILGNSGSCVTAQLVLLAIAIGVFGLGIGITAYRWRAEMSPDTSQSKRALYLFGEVALPVIAFGALALMNPAAALCFFPGVNPEVLPRVLAAIALVTAVASLILPKPTDPAKRDEARKENESKNVEIKTTKDSPA